MGRKRRRSEAGESECDDSPAVPAQKKRHHDKWSVPEELYRKTELSHELYDFLRKYKDVNSRCLCECLIRAPSRRQQPDYYEVIAAPIDLMRIQQRLKTDEYRSVPSFISDVQLLLDNAKRFYKKGSEELGNVMTLEDAFLQRLQEFWEDPEGLSRVKSPTPLTLRISKDQLLPAVLSPTSSSSAAVGTGKQHRSKAVTPSSSEATASQSGSKSSSSGKLAIRVKVTRSKAWLEEYVKSNEPVKMFLAAVYNYHDSSGEFVAEAFHSLPSAKDYPEYYHIITEPIDLNMIRKNVEDGKYSNLRDIQVDMLLLVKNAHYFNETGSEIYKLATTLRKFIINRCAELEKKHQTVPKIAPLKVSLKRSVGGAGESHAPSTSSAHEEQKKVPKLKLKLSGEDARGQRSSNSSLESEGSESESSGDLSSETEGEGKERGKLLLQVKKEKAAADQDEVDPVTKLLKAKRLPILKKRMMAVYRSLVSKTDKDGRLLCELFMRRPSPKVYPEYYLVIKQPIDLREILHRIKTKQYSSMEELMANVDLMVQNACTFNEEESQVYNDALVLQEVAKEANNRLQQGWTATSPSTTIKPAPRGRPPKGRTASLSAQLSSALNGTPAAAQSVGKGRPTPIVSLFDAVKFCVSSSRLVWLGFKQLPLQLSTDSSLVKKPLNIPAIQSKVETDQYASVDQLFEDFHLLFDSTCRSYPRESQLHRDAVILHRVAVRKYLTLTAAEREKRVVPDIQKCVQALLQEIIIRTTNFMDVSGKQPADSLRTIVAAQELPQEGEEAPAKRAFTLSRVEQWVLGGHYSRLDHLQFDLLALLRHARRTSGGRGSQVYKDSVALLRQFVTVRDTVCRNGELLWSPAMEYTHRELEAELSSETSQPLPSPLSGSAVRASTPIVMVENSPSKQHSPEPTTLAESDILPDESNREYFQETEYEGTTYKVGDIVYIAARKPDQRPHLVLIEKLWKDGSERFWLDGCWFYRPEETYHLATKKFYEKEVFKSDFHGLAQLSHVQGRCHVMFVRDYPKYKPEGFPEGDVYVCESRYSFKTRIFKKIKIWNFMPGKPLQLVARETPLVLKRFPSVFSRNQPSGVEPESDQVKDGMEAEEEASMDVDVDAGNTSVDVLEMSFCENLENVPATTSNPEAGCKYYVQYCIDDDRFRLGDFVYVRSDQERPFIARINNMWTDANDDPWFHGPWFVWPDEVFHFPTRMFYKRELFMSNIQDTNPMRSIIGKCAVLFLADYCKKRPTEFAEVDVFMTECRYNENEHDIRKMKGLKQFQLSPSTTADEVYYFSEELHLVKVPSPNLFPKPSDSFPPVSKELPGRSSSVSTSTAPPSTTRPLPAPLPTPPSTLPAAAPSTTPTATPTSQSGVPNLLGMSPHLLQALLSTASQQLSSTRPVIIPLQQPPLKTASPLSTTTSVSASPAVNTTPSVQRSSSRDQGGYMCRWEDCGVLFESISDLTTHLMYSSPHLIRDREGNYFCRWGLCPRNPKFGGKSFDAMTKLTRHMREVHLMKLTQSSPRACLWYSGLPPRASLLSSSLLQPSAPSVPAAPPPSTPITPSAPTTHHTTPITTIPPVMAKPIIVPAVADVSSARATTRKPVTSVPSIFHSPPEDRRQLVHSDIYLRYIRGLQSGSKYMSNCESSEKIRATQQPHPPRHVQVSDWVAPEALQQGGNLSVLKDALWALRDHLLIDSKKLAKHLEENN